MLAINEWPVAQGECGGHSRWQSLSPATGDSILTISTVRAVTLTILSGWLDRFCGTLSRRLDGLYGEEFNPDSISDY